MKIHRPSSIVHGHFRRRKMARRIGKGLLILLVVLLLVYGLAAVFSPSRPDRPVLAEPAFLVMAHQGGDKLWPGNTLYAFERAAEMGVDVLEMDIHRTADGVLVVIHDDTVDRTTNGSGRVREMTLAEIQELDAAYHWPYEGDDRPYRGQGLTIPTVAELFVALPQMRMNIDMKQWDADVPPQLCRLVREYDMSRQVIAASFSGDIMREFRRHCPEVATALGESEVRVFFGLSSAYLGAAYWPVADALQVPEYGGGFHLVTRRFVETAHRHNIKVHVWTVDEIEAMQRLIDLGVDGIFTDRPDRLMALLGRQ
jgi:glycerophosphoryl diester phosphodiesterase